MKNIGRHKAFRDSGFTDGYWLPRTQPMQLWVMGSDPKECEAVASRYSFPGWRHCCKTRKGTRNVPRSVHGEAMRRGAACRALLISIRYELSSKEGRPSAARSVSQVTFRHSLWSLGTRERVLRIVRWSLVLIVVCALLPGLGLAKDEPTGKRSPIERHKQIAKKREPAVIKAKQKASPKSVDEPVARDKLSILDRRCLEAGPEGSNKAFEACCRMVGTDARDKHGRTLLIIAAAKGAFKCVRILLERDAEVNSRDESQATALMYAAEKGFPGIVRLLASHCAEIDAKDQRGESALSRAAVNRQEKAVALLTELGAKKTLLAAAILGQESLARELVRNGADVNARTAKGRTALSVAAEAGKAKIVEYLLKKGAQPNTTDSDGHTPMTRAAVSGHAEVVAILKAHGVKMTLPVAAMLGDESASRRLIAEGSDVNTRGPQGRTALVYAIARRQYKIVPYLLTQGAEVNTRDHRGLTPLMAAADRAPMDVVERLTRGGANVNAQGSRRGTTPLMIATARNRMDVCRHLIKHGATVDLRVLSGSYKGSSALHIAATVGNLELIKLLIENGADIEANTARGTPLNIASSEGHLPAVRVLVARGSNIESRDRFGNSPLESAARDGHTDVVKFLIMKGANVDSRSQQGFSPLAGCAQNCRVEAAKILLEHGANVHIRSVHSNTPLHVAVGPGCCPDMVRLLLSKGADVNSQGNLGATPLICATQHPCERTQEIMKILLDNGANMFIKAEDGSTAFDRVKDSNPKLFHFLLRECIVRNKGMIDDKGKKKKHQP